ncbi:hypothetical protein [Mycetocola sp. JXN-3]|uniref:hypothetical protein n=1 Tax=Mycetocola sp. JXN-3 TaxID=2116510 RepID=UPI00165CF4AC|nr:hypothetical protein [Mycetocola sp. JXN-3]
MLGELQTRLAEAQLKIEALERRVAAAEREADQSREQLRAARNKRTSRVPGTRRSS